ncbi:MAG TPA: glycosyltransferase family 4 protein [Armatimonadota bacterium]|jgi:glycosyltransferase involved in cell wall biosynthesis
MSSGATGRRRILYLGRFHFPEGDAAAARVVGLGKALREAGYAVAYAGHQPESREEDRQPDGSYRYQGFGYVSLSETRTKKLSPARRLLRYLDYGRGAAEWLAQQDLSDVAAVLLYNGLSGYYLRLGPICRRAGVPLVSDCTEWYDPSQCVGGPLGIGRWDVELTMRRLLQRADGMIAISGWLERFYKPRGLPVLRVPPLVDLSDPKWPAQGTSKQGGGAIRLVYSGVPARKDLLSRALQGVCELRSQGHSIVLDLYGPTREQVARCLEGSTDLLDRLGEGMVLHGRIPQREVPARLAEADLAVLLRPEKRYAQAGFSTKVVESMASGTPVLTNATSDLAYYIRDGVEGLLLPGHSVEEFVAGARKALEMGREALGRMGQAARARAEECFDYRQYVAPLAGFLEEVAAKARH